MSTKALARLAEVGEFTEFLPLFPEGVAERSYLIPHVHLLLPVHTITLIVSLLQLLPVSS